MWHVRSMFRCCEDINARPFDFLWLCCNLTWLRTEHGWDGARVRRRTSEMEHGWDGARVRWSTGETENEWDGARVRWSTCEIEHEWDGARVRWSTSEVEHEWDGARVRWSTSEMEHEWDGARVRWSTSEPLDHELRVNRFDQFHLSQYKKFRYVIYHFQTIINQQVVWNYTNAKF